MASCLFMSTSTFKVSMRLLSHSKGSRCVSQSILYQFLGWSARKPACVAKLRYSNRNAFIAVLRISSVKAISMRSSHLPGFHSLSIAGVSIQPTSPCGKIHYLPSCSHCFAHSLIHRGEKGRLLFSANFSSSSSEESAPRSRFTICV